MRLKKIEEMNKEIFDFSEALKRNNGGKVIWKQDNY